MEAVAAAAVVEKVVKVCKLLKQVIDVCKKTCEFTHRLSVAAMHFDTVLELLMDGDTPNKKLTSKSSAGKLLEEYESHLDQLLLLASTFAEKSFLGKAWAREEQERAVESALGHISRVESALNMQLGLSQADGIQDISKELSEAKSRDEAMASMLQGLGNQFEEFVRQEEQHRHDVQRHGKLVTFFKGIAADLAAKGTASPWIASGPAFRSLVFTLKGDAQRDMLKHLRVGLGSSMNRIELIKNQTLVALSQVFEQLSELPDDFREGDTVKTLMANLEEQQKRVSELCLSVSFIGPAKSGKSTAINAILGNALFPSDTFPMTVMPTVIRHAPGQKTPRLQLKNSAIKVMEEACAKIRENANAIRDGCQCTRVELEYFSRIVDGPEPPTFAPLKDFSDVKDLREDLSLLNHLCRIWARALDKCILEGDNPLLFLTRDCAWPVVLLELELLKDVALTGTFELMDTPGRDEISLLPDIKGAVNSAMRNAAALVCVLNSQTAMTDSMKMVKRELKAALRFELPVYLLANRIDGIGEGKKIPDLELAIGREFLEDGYNPQTRQVFGVSGLEALNFSVLRKLCGHPDFMKTVKKLPDLVNDHGAMKDDTSDVPIDREKLLMLLAFLKQANGDQKWKRAIKKLDEDELDEDLHNLYLKSRFDAFQHKLMKELAPIAGQKVLVDQISHVQCHFRDLIASMDRYCDLALASDDEFKFREQRITMLLRSLREALINDMPKILSKHQQLIADRLAVQQRKLKGVMIQKVNQVMSDIENRGLQGFTLCRPPTAEEKAKHEHLASVGDEKYWETPENLKSNLQTALRDRVQGILSDELEEFVKQSENEFDLVKVELRDALAAAMTSNMFSTEALNGLTSVDTADFVLQRVDLKLPDEDYESTTDKMETRHYWYTLWLVPISVVVGTTFLLPLGKAKQAMHTQVGETMVRMTAETALKQCKAKLSEIYDMVKTIFESRIKLAERDLAAVAKQRQGSENTKELVAAVAKSRILCEGLYVELLILLHYAEAGDSSPELRIKKDQSETDIAEGDVKEDRVMDIEAAATEGGAMTDTAAGDVKEDRIVDTDAAATEGGAKTDTAECVVKEDRAMDTEAAATAGDTAKPCCCVVC